MGETRFALWGAGGHARVISDLLTLRGCRVVSLFDNDRSVASPWPDVPVFYGCEGMNHFLLETRDGLPHAAVAIGGARGRERCDIADMMELAGMRLPPLIHPQAIVATSASIADGVQVLAGAIIAASASLGRNVIVNTGAQVDHECILEDGVHLAPGAVLCGCVKVGANSLIGPRAVVLPRVTIGTDVIVGAGSVVTKDLPDGVVAWGSPARKIRENVT